MNSRDKILKRMREVQQNNDYELNSIVADAEIYRDYVSDRSKLMNQFTNNLTALSGECILVDDTDDAYNALEIVLKKHDLHKCLKSEETLIHSVFSCTRDSGKTVSQEINLDSQSFSEIDAGITSADFLIARSGSIVLNSKTSDGRRLSVLPPVHIVIATSDQIVPSLDSVLNIYRETGFDWSYATIISGPSRTSDIEKQLVLGAHGPKKLIVIIIKNNQ